MNLHEHDRFSIPSEPGNECKTNSIKIMQETTLPFILDPKIVSPVKSLRYKIGFQTTKPPTPTHTHTPKKKEKNLAVRDVKAPPLYNSHLLPTLAISYFSDNPPFCYKSSK